MTASASPSRGQVCEIEHLNVILQPFPLPDALTWIGHAGIDLTNEREWDGASTHILSLLLVSWKLSRGDAHILKHIYKLLFPSVVNITLQNAERKKVTLAVWNNVVFSRSEASKCLLWSTMEDIPEWLELVVSRQLYPIYVCFHRSVSPLFNTSQEMSQRQQFYLPIQTGTCASPKCSLPVISLIIGPLAYLRRKSKGVKEVQIN